MPPGCRACPKPLMIQDHQDHRPIRQSSPGCPGSEEERGRCPPSAGRTPRVSSSLGCRQGVDVGCTAAGHSVVRRRQRLIVFQRRRRSPSQGAA